MGKVCPSVQTWKFSSPPTWTGHFPRKRTPPRWPSRSHPSSAISSTRESDSTTASDRELFTAFQSTTIFLLRLCKAEDVMGEERRPDRAPHTFLALQLRTLTRSLGLSFTGRPSRSGAPHPVTLLLYLLLTANRPFWGINPSSREIFFFDPVQL